MNNQVIILTTNAEKTVNDIIIWLLNYQILYYRFDGFKDINVSIGIDNFDINLNKEIIKSANIKSFWNRKGHLKIHINHFFSDREEIDFFLNYLSNESNIIGNFLIQQLEEKKHLGNYFLQIPNKLSHLSIAQKSGLEIPKTTITNDKEAVINFKKDSPNIINKSLSDSFTGIFNQIYYYNHTERVSNDVIEELDDSFFPSLFQEELQKAYELRIVFVQETLWSMAIFSQNDEKTQVDWRNYNYEKPNRKVPFQLPDDIADNVRKFIRASGLNTGAIDMVVTKDRKYVFLECNPNGQISMVSEHCNYFIERYIAEYLSTP